MAGFGTGDLGFLDDQGDSICRPAVDRHRRRKRRKRATGRGGGRLPQNPAIGEIAVLGTTAGWPR